MKTIHTILIILLFPMLVFSQTDLNPLNSTPYIEVTGEGEMDIIPDEIYLHFTLKERYDGKTKVDIEDLEKKLKQKLRNININLENLYLADADAEYVKIKRKNKDVLASKDYILKISSTGELAKAWEIMDEIDALSAFINRVDHSKMDEFKKEVKVKAIQNAKEKATYLLAAVDQKIGKALFIQERENYAPIYNMRSKQMMATLDVRQEEESMEEPEISFQKIKLKYKVFARFAIE